MRNLTNSLQGRDAPLHEHGRLTHNFDIIMHNHERVVADFNEDSQIPLKIANDTLKLVCNHLRVMHDPEKDDAKLLISMCKPVKVMHGFNEINANLRKDVSFQSKVMNNHDVEAAIISFNYRPPSAVTSTKRIIYI